MRFAKPLFSLLVFILFVTGCQSATGTENAGDTNSEGETDELTPVKVGYLPTTGHSLYYIAEEEGFFEEAGLDITLSSFNNSGEGINAVAAGQLDVGTFGTAAPLKFEEEGAEFIFFGGQMGTGAGVVAKADQAEALKDPANFAGKKVATVSLATGDVVWRGALAEAGLDWEEDLEIIEMQSPADVITAVNQGEVDAGVVWVPFVEKAKQEGLEIVSYSDDYFPEHVCGRLIANPSKFEENPDLYVGFMEAMIKAEAFLQDENNKDSVIKDVAKYIDVDEEIIEKDLYSDYLIQTADPDKEAILAFRDTMVNIGYLEESRDVSDIINIDVYKQALDNVMEQDTDNPYYDQLIDRYEDRNLDL
ncbi:ABC transporter substrate-binding protein [Aquibacillus rhizosphaerae]|uniref:ABC transporter substrate-binding protein n=1 Tax=Aquibacillus rhizosphaerae TaxID=3051431 RepID=A0ABT7L049_9BACI|nr:ABC transporter substrate-binding protein [Aquibacillus sp. LR5S19]MDL4839178.1 ABC transporter substrate-binding protein [Aquibacillus sp. LR5S19]